MIKYALIFSILLLAFSSCFKEDDPIQPHEKGDLEEEIIPLTQYYVNQVYFNVSSGEQVSQNKKGEFDLSFSSTINGHIIRLNSASFMTAALTDYSELQDVTDTIGLEWKFDKPDGNPDSTAFSGWIGFDDQDTTYINKVWVINRGINEEGFVIGLKKIIFTKLSNGKYHFSFSNMDNTAMQEFVVEKNEGYNYIQFSFDEGGLVKQLEPKSDNWDLLFTQYTSMVSTLDGSDSYPYLVTGTLINPVDVAVAFDSILVFVDIVIGDVIGLEFSTDQDAIGYEWKELVGDVGGGDFYYKTFDNYNYIIKSRGGGIYKLHFTGFYDKETGEKGYPTFEYQKL